MDNTSTNNSNREEKHKKEETKEYAQSCCKRFLEDEKLKGTNISINEDYSKETLEIRKEKWKEVKELRKNGTYAILVYDKVVIKGKYRKQ